MITGTDEILGESITSRLESELGTSFSSEERDTLINFWSSVSDEIIRHFVTNVLVNTVVIVDGTPNNGIGEIL